MNLHRAETKIPAVYFSIDVYIYVCTSLVLTFEEKPYIGIMRFVHIYGVIRGLLQPKEFKTYIDPRRVQPICQSFIFKFV